MAVFSVRGQSAATAATANHAIGALWNVGTSSKRIRVIETGLFKTAAGTAADSLVLQRITARGTAGSTITPDADNAWTADTAPGSGALLDLAAYSAQPTLATPPLWGWAAAAVAASGVIWPTPRGIELPSGTGLALIQIKATAWPASEVYFVWEE
jgi:hypothetical protein